MWRLLSVLMIFSIPAGYVWTSKANERIRRAQGYKRTLEKAETLCRDENYHPNYRGLCVMKCQVDLGSAMLRPENKQVCEDRWGNEKVSSSSATTHKLRQ